MSGIVNALVPIDTISPHPDNYNQHPEPQIAQLEASYQELGQYNSIVLWARPGGTYTQVARHGFLTAAKNQGATEIRADILPEDTDPLVVKRIMLADNLHAQNSQPDDTLLAQLLQEQVDAGYSLASIGTDEEMLRQMLESLGDSYLGGDTQEGEYSDETEDNLAAPDTIFSNETIAAEAFKHFRNTGFPYRKLPVYMSMQEINKLASSDDRSWLQSRLGYHVADTYHHHRMAASAEKMKSPIEAFHDDVLLARAMRVNQEHGRGIPLEISHLLYVTSGTQACSNFRPGFALYLYRKYCKPGDVVLDTSTGYGGRLVGFVASGMAGKYIGIDPNTETHQANIRMASDLNFADKIELYNLPAEDVPHVALANRCDFAFTSPPYFAKEHYSDEDTQSWKRYQTGDAWRTGFLQKMLALQFVALKPGAYAIINIADVKLRDKTYPLAHWTIEDGKRAGFTYVETLEFELTHRFGAGQEDEVATEPVIVLRKPVQEMAHV